MIHEIASISVRTGSEAEFERAVNEAVPLFLRAAGCHAVRLERVIERPGDYRLVVAWDDVERHLDFRQSPDFGKWRALVGHCFANPPEVVHVQVALDRSRD